MVVDKAPEELVKHLLCVWSLPAGCTRAAQSLVHVPHLENSVLKPQLEPLPFSWQAFFVPRKRGHCID